MDYQMDIYSLKCLFFDVVDDFVGINGALFCTDFCMNGGVALSGAIVVDE